MKILTIATCFDRHEGDVITPWLTEAVKHLQARGHDIEVLASSYRGLTDHVVHGVQVRRFRYFPARWERLTHEETAPDRVRRSLLFKAMVPCYVLSGMVRAFRLARKRRYDVIHVHWPLPHFLMAWAARAACRGALVSTFHGVEFTWVNARMRFLRPFLRWVLRESDAVTVNSSFTASQVATIGSADVRVIPFGAGMPFQAEKAPRAYGAHAGPRRILYIGRLVERKGVRYLLEALPLVRRKIDAEAVIVGDGPLMEPLKAQARDLGIAGAVRFAGFVPTDELRRLFEGCDLFVLPAVVDSMGCTEGLGVVLIEAMSHAKPVVASNVGGIPDVVEDRATGRLVPPGSADELAAAVIEVLEDPEHAGTLGAQGYRKAVEAFSWDAIAGKIESLYESLLASGKSRPA